MTYKNAIAKLMSTLVRSPDDTGAAAAVEEFAAMSASQLVSRYNALVDQATAVELTGYRQVRVFHDKPTALARITQLESALSAHRKGEQAEAKRGDEHDQAERDGTHGALAQAWRQAADETASNEEVLQTSPGRARLLASPQAEEIRQAVLADQARATEQAAVTNPANQEDTMAKAKKTKAPKTPRAKKEKTNGANGGGRRQKFGDDQKITILAEGNPRRGPAAEAFKCYRTGSTVGAVVGRMVDSTGCSRGKALQHVVHDAAKGHVRVD